MKYLLLLILMTSTFYSFSQVGIGTTNPDASAALEIESTDSGILIPRLTQTERNAITTPATGLLIYQTNNTAGFYYYDGSAWQPFGGGGSADNDWTISGNDIYNANTGNVGVGTTIPTRDLDVDGDVRIRQKLWLEGSSNAAAGEQLTLLGTVPSGEVKATGFPVFNFVTYNLANVLDDWVYEFDTKIPSSEYYLMIVGHSFDTLLQVNPNTPDRYAGTSVLAYSYGGTWRLRADHKDITSENGIDGTWTLHCVVVPASLTNKLSDENHDMGGSHYGGAPSAPTGL